MEGDTGTDEGSNTSLHCGLRFFFRLRCGVAGQGYHTGQRG